MIKQLAEPLLAAKTLIVFCMTLSVYDIVEEFTVLLNFIEVCRDVFKHSSLKVPPKHFSQVEVGALVGGGESRVCNDRVLLL